MEIGPIKNGGPLPGEPDAQKSQKETVETITDRSDSVRISDAGRSRLKAGGDSTEASGSQRYRQIRERIDSGYYDREHIREETIERLIDNMLENIKEFYK